MKAFIITGLVLVFIAAFLLFVFYYYQPRPPLSEHFSLFSCGDIVNYEGRDYKTVELGGNCWFQENLNVGEMIESRKTADVQTTAEGKIQKYCYDNNPENCEIYGGLYQWHMAMNLPDDPCLSKAGLCIDQIDENHQGICPNGWRIPTLEDYRDIIPTYYDREWTPYRLKELFVEGETGFEIMLAGFRNGLGGSFEYLEELAYFWTVSVSNSMAEAPLLSPYVKSEFSNYPRFGYSVRCIKIKN